MEQQDDRRSDESTDRPSRHTDENAWREAIGDDGFFRDRTRELLGKGIGGFILTGCPQPNPDQDAERPTESLRPEDVEIVEMDPETTGVIIAPAPRQPKRRDPDRDGEAG